jgi:hypothetical protein
MYIERRHCAACHARADIVGSAGENDRHRDRCRTTNESGCAAPCALPGFLSVENAVIEAQPKSESRNKQPAIIRARKMVTFPSEFVIACLTAIAILAAFQSQIHPRLSPHTEAYRGGAAGTNFKGRMRERRAD